jgi:hypothetical protein
MRIYSPASPHPPVPCSRSNSRLPSRWSCCFSRSPNLLRVKRLVPRRRISHSVLTYAISGRPSGRSRRRKERSRFLPAVGTGISPAVVVVGSATTARPARSPGSAARWPTQPPSAPRSDGTGPRRNWTFASAERTSGHAATTSRAELSRSGSEDPPSSRPGERSAHRSLAAPPTRSRSSPPTAICHRGAAWCRDAPPAPPPHRAGEGDPRPETTGSRSPAAPDPGPAAASAAARAAAGRSCRTGSGTPRARRSCGGFPGSAVRRW